MDKEEDLRKENLKIDNFKSMLTRDINMSNLSVGMIYYILKDTLNEVGNLFSQQANLEYKEFCDLMNKEDAEADKTNEESNSEAEEGVAANNNEEGTK